MTEKRTVSPAADHASQWASMLQYYIFLQNSVTIQEPTEKTEDVVMCCLIRDIARFREL
jgi:hypothetical protein